MKSDFQRLCNSDAWVGPVGKFTQSWMDTIRSHHERCRLDAGLSHETFNSHVVHAHEATNTSQLSDVELRSQSTDLFRRLANESQNVTRAKSDDKHHGRSINLMPTLLACLPIEQRAALAEELLRPLGLGVRVLAAGESHHSDMVTEASNLLREGAEATQAVLALAVRPTPVTRQVAARELRESLDAGASLLQRLESEITGEVLHLDNYVGNRK